ncbi:DUF6734 family protein [Mucilaginibacter lutimaris]|uniref:DUF6734 family protein n=1 Tax=Mucilaginibacter lutimaris TaxID=931629 RepID=A0ABW2ZC25_9SPHI
MKILQTFWTGPTQVNKKDVLSMKAGWLSCEYHWMSWALSCLQAKSVFGSVNLVTDKAGKEVLIDLLQLPYANVSIALEGTLNNYHPELWALAKIYTYSTQTEPFLHLDGDVYLWQIPHQDLLNAPLIAQNLDKGLPFYAEILDNINNQLSYVPELFSREYFEFKEARASNAGLLGGHNLAFFKEYCSKAFEFIDNNTSDLEKMNTGSLNLIFEQYLFCQLAQKLNIPITYYNAPVEDPVFKDYIRFEDYPNLKMIHPVGGFKQYAHVCDHLAKLLRNDYPDYYYRIINLMRNKGVKMRSVIYNTPGFSLHGVLKSNSSASTAQPAFHRTQAVVNYLNKKLHIHQLIDFDKNIRPHIFNKLVNLSALNNDDKERLLEVFNIETKSNYLSNNIYSDAEAINKLYIQNINAYKLIRQTFSLPKHLLLQTRVDIQEPYKQFEVGWDWKYDYHKDIPSIVERNFGQEKLALTVILLPDVLQAGIKEYYPDGLDLIVVETLKTSFSVELLLTEMKQYFSEEEIEEDYPAYETLIIDVVKRLLYFGLLKINLH